MRRTSGAPDETGFAPTETLGDAPWLVRREAHYESALGPMGQPGVYHWEEDTDPHVDVYVVSRCRGRGHEVLITGGMADRPMPGLKPGGTMPRRLEILLAMPRAEEWAAVILREIALVPFRHGLVLEEGRLIRGSRSIRDGSALRHAVLRRSDEPRLAGFLVEGEAVEFLQVCFITEEELRYGMEHGSSWLLDALEKSGADPVLDLGRQCLFGPE